MMIVSIVVKWMNLALRCYTVYQVRDNIVPI